jgi:glucarate dehydratase
MRVATLEATPVSFPYVHREVSSLVARDGVTDVIIRIETDDGCVGWGEACSGADVVSVEAAIHAMEPFVLGSDPWHREAIQHQLYQHGLWQFRAGTANFAWAGIDMALADVAARAAGLPLYKLFGGLRRKEASYFYYLARGTSDDLSEQCRAGLRAGFDTFYLKVGVDPAADLAMVEAVRDALGSGPRLRLDANGAWSGPQASRLLGAMAEYDIDFVEQPVRHDPVNHLAELRGRVPMPVCANEGLWSEADAYARIVARQADVYCFSPYWVGSLAAFQRLAYVAHLEGLQVCKHTHGELGIAAVACHHLLLTLPNGVEGHQQTAHLMAGDVLSDPLPIARGPRWGVPEGVGLGVEPAAEAIADGHRLYELEGQFLPYGPEHRLVWGAGESGSR